MNENHHPAKPEKNIRVGPVRAAIWKQNNQTRDGQAFESVKVVLERSYKDRYGQWQNTNRYDLNDIPKAILALEKAYEYILAKSADEPNGAAADCPTVEEIAM